MVILKIPYLNPSMRRISPTDLKCPDWDHSAAATARQETPWLEVGLPLIAIAVLGFFHAWIMAAMVGVISGGLVALRVLCPEWRKMVDRGFGHFAEAVGKVMAVVMLAIPFFIVMTAIRIFNRVMGNDPLQLRGRDAASYWQPCDSESRRAGSIRRMFCSERLTRGRLALMPLAGIAVLLAGATEVGLRLYGFGKPILFVQDADIGYYPRPNQEAHYPGRVISINNHGMRSPDIAMPKPVGKMRILLIGDSTLAGTRVANEQLYSTLLEKQLNEAAGKSAFEVLNMGVNAWGPMHEQAYLKKFGDFDSDLLVICGPVANAFRPRYGLERLPFSPANHPPRFALEQLAYELMWRMREKTLGAPAWSLPGTHQEQQVRTGVDAYASMAAEMQSKGGEVMMEMLPARPVTLGQGEDPEGNEIFAAIGRRLAGIGVIPHLAGPIFKDVPHPAEIYYDGVHFDVRGHRLYADFLAKRLREGSARVREVLAH